VRATNRTYMIVSADEPVTAAAAITRAPTPPDLCVKSPSERARETAGLAFAGRYVRTIDEPLLAGRGPAESAADFAGRYAEALRVLYALDTRSAFVIFDALGAIGGTALLLDETSLLRIAEWIESEVPLP
jgi:broad specificity phosphatase PhoE